jgi:hypothetical protein
VSALEDYAIEITQEEKTLTMRWDKRVWPRFDQPKKSKRNNKT